MTNCNNCGAALEPICSYCKTDHRTFFYVERDLYDEDVEYALMSGFDEDVKSYGSPPPPPVC